MSAALADITELCGALTFYANRLDGLRRAKTANSGKVNGSTYLVDTATADTISPWYRVVEPIYAELDHYVRGVKGDLCDSVFRDTRMRDIETRLHRLRACYELDKEIDEATAILEGKEPGAALARMTEQQAYWTLTPAVRDVLADCRNVAVIGSGPLPLTALAVAAELGCQVTCIERDPLAFDLGTRLIAMTEYRDLVETVCMDVDEMAVMSDFDAVLGSVLLGVSIDDVNHAAKDEVVLRMMDRADADTPLVLRDPYGLGRLFYPPMDVSRTPSLDVARLDPETGPDLPYRSSFLIIRKGD
jgi:nicotianamine synthase-like protein